MANPGKATPTPPQDLSQSFQRLAESANRLNKASDELSRAIGPIEAVFKKLNLGIAKWHVFFGPFPDQDGDYHQLEIGYAKMGGKWCIALAEESGNVHASDPDYGSRTSWAFNDAPRQLRIRAVKEIPKLLEALVEEADKVTSELEVETRRAQEVGETLTTLAATSGVRR